MSLVHIDGFDDGLITARATNSAALGGKSGRTGPSGVGGGNSTFFISWTRSAGAHATWVIGFAWRTSQLSPSTNHEIAALWGDSGATRHITLALTPAGAIRVFRGTTSGVLLGDSNDGVVGANAWHYIELYVTMSDTVGVVKLRLNGAIPAGWSDLTNVDTRNGGTNISFDTLVLDNNRTQDGYDDLYILNGAGSVNNDLLGDVRVRTLYPNGNGNYSQLLGSDADSVDNYLLVDENPTPNTTDYVGSATDGQKDTYACEDLPGTSTSVFGVMASMYSAKSDTGAKSCRAVARRSAVDAVGSDFVLSTSYVPNDQIWDQDPTDSSAWTPTKVNDMEFGFEVRP